MAEISLEQVRDGLQKLFNAGPSVACSAFPLAQWIEAINNHLDNPPAVEPKVSEAVAGNWINDMISECRKAMPKSINSSYNEGYDDAMNDVADRLEFISKQPASVVIDDAMILKTARHLCQKSSYICNVNEEDNWKLYSEEFCSEAFMTLHVALGGGV